MNIIFLDIDGVLNTAESRREYGLLFIDPVKLEWIREIINETGALIVLSSSWRLEKELFTLISSVLPIHSKTWNPVWVGNRADEILEWLKRNTVTRFVIIDDLEHAGIGFGKIPDLTGEEFGDAACCRSGAFFKTEDDIGLTYDMVIKIKQFFI